MLIGEHGGDPMLAHIAMMQALQRHAPKPVGVKRWQRMSVIGEDRTPRVQRGIDAFDPERTWTLCQGMPSAAAQSAAPSTPASGSTQKKDFGCPFHQVAGVRSSTRDKNVFRIDELLAL
jgi:hypothetical protein